MVNFRVEERSHFSLVEFEIPGGVLEPQELGELRPPEVRYDKGVVLSGRGPVWLYAALTHHYHPSRWVATHDPRLGGAVVVESHVPDVQVGQIYSLAPEKDVELEA